MGESPPAIFQYSDVTRLPSGDRRQLPEKLKKEEARSEEHTSELQSQSNLVCRLLLEIKTVQDWSAGIRPCYASSIWEVRCARRRGRARARSGCIPSRPPPVRDGSSSVICSADQVEGG